MTFGSLGQRNMLKILQQQNNNKSTYAGFRDDDSYARRLKRDKTNVQHLFQKGCVLTLFMDVNFRSSQFVSSSFHKNCNLKRQFHNAK